MANQWWQIFAQSTTPLGFYCKEMWKKILSGESGDNWLWEGWSWEKMSASNAAKALQLLLNLVVDKGAPHIRCHTFKSLETRGPVVINIAPIDRADGHIDFMILLLWIITCQDKWSFYRLLGSCPWKGFFLGKKLWLLYKLSIQLR